MYENARVRLVDPEGNELASAPVFDMRWNGESHAMAITVVFAMRDLGGFTLRSEDPVELRFTVTPEPKTTLTVEERQTIRDWLDGKVKISEVRKILKEMAW